jgi:class 3 adenylate cyclase/tetratricopeptide (TPR) repeat protein
VIICGGCNAELPDRSKFCLECGTPVYSAAQGVAQERKIVTSVFCDLVAFTAMSEAADPEDVDAMLGRYFTVARSAIEAFGGVVEKFIGDAVVGVFGVPAAHEDDPERAVRAGLRIVDAVDGLTGPDGSPLQLRVGINTGEALVRLDVTPGSGEGFLTGDAVNTAARIQSAAPPMGVAVGRTTFEATEPVFDYVELEPATVKGKADPVGVWQAVAPLARLGTDLTRRHDSPLIGRENDLALLKGIFDKTVAATTPQLVTINGEPGLGKSRLVAELFAHIDSVPELVIWRQGRCLPYGEGITFWALGEIVRAHAGIIATDAADVVQKKLDAVLPEVDERAWMKQRLLPLVGIEASSSAEQGELFAAWTRFLEHMAGTSPTVLIFEDLHWADPALLAFVDHLAGHATGVPMLIVGTARPELYERHPDYGRGLRNTTAINLRPLTEDETTYLVASLLETLAVPDELRLPLVERAGGNPLFAEEYVRLLQDQDLLERVGDQVGLRHGVELPLPDNVQALIAARLDTLPPERKSLLADAAVVGRVFWAGAVAAMSGVAEADVVEVMRELALKELVRAIRTSSMAGQREYSFWHVLTRDVAYSQLPRSSRAARHVAAAEWVESRSGERVDDQAEVLAYHYFCAHELAVARGDDGLAAQVMPSAVRFLLSASERSLGLDPPTAVEYAERILSLAEPGSPESAHATVLLGRAALQSGRLAQARPALESALANAVEAADFPSAIRIAADLTDVLQRLNDPGWVDVPVRSLRMLDGLPLAPELVFAETEMARRYCFLDDPRAALDSAERALRYAQRLGMETPVRALGYHAMARSALVDAGALDEYAMAIRLCDQAGDTLEGGVLRNNYALATRRLRGSAAAERVCRESIEYSKSRGMLLGAETTRGILEDCLYDLGRLTEIFTPESSAVAGAGEDQYLIQSSRVTQARALVLLGRAEEADRWLDWLVEAGRGQQNPGLFAAVIGTAAYVHAALGRRDQAAQLFSEHLVRTASSGIEECLTDWVRALLTLGEISLARELCDQPKGPSWTHEATVLSTTAALLEVDGEIVEAGSRYALAATSWRRLTVLVEEAFALLGQGRCLIALDRPDAAIPVLERARDMFAEMGARPALTETEELLAATSS